MNMNTRYVTTRTAWAAPALASLQRRGAVTSVKRGLLIKQPPDCRRTLCGL